MSTTSIPLDELSLAQLVQLNQGLGRQAEELRAQRIYLRRKINERLALGEREHAEVEETRDATAPGALVEVSARA